jgi:hypothetical protein
MQAIRVDKCKGESAFAFRSDILNGFRENLASFLNAASEDVAVRKPEAAESEDEPSFPEPSTAPLRTTT